jgi:hypothetical protein
VVDAEGTRVLLARGEFVPNVEGESCDCDADRVEKPVVEGENVLPLALAPALPLRVTVALPLSDEAYDSVGSTVADVFSVGKPLMEIQLVVLADEESSPVEVGDSVDDRDMRVDFDSDAEELGDELTLALLVSDGDALDIADDVTVTDAVIEDEDVVEELGLASAVSLETDTVGLLDTVKLADMLWHEVGVGETDAESVIWDGDAVSVIWEKVGRDVVEDEKEGTSVVEGASLRVADEVVETRSVIVSRKDELMVADTRADREKLGEDESDFDPSADWLKRPELEELVE